MFFLFSFLLSLYVLVFCQLDVPEFSSSLLAHGKFGVVGSGTCCADFSKLAAFEEFPPRKSRPFPLNRGTARRKTLDC